MSKLFVFFFIVFLAVLALFAIYNQRMTTVTIPFGGSYETPTIAIILLSLSIGALAMLFVFVVRDTRRYVSNIQYQKRQKRDAKIQDLYAKALDHLFAHHNLAEAKQLFRAILSEDPEHRNALLQLGDIALAEGDFRAAREHYQRARDLYPGDVEVLFALTKLMEKMERWSDALAYVEEILDIDDKNLTALYRKRDLLERLEQWDEVVLVQKAILKYEHAEKDKSRERQNLVGYKYEYGRHSLENGDLEKAKKAFRTVLRLDKNFAPASLGLAEVLVREGEHEEAINLLEKTYEQTSSLIILLRLEDLLISAGEPLRLIRIYKNNILKNPHDMLIKFFLGRLYYRLEMIDDAFDVLTSIDTSGTVYPGMHQLLGNLYMKRNQVEKAVLEYQKALESHAGAFSFTYRCQACGYTSSDWSGRCPQCRQWSSYQLNLSA